VAPALGDPGKGRAQAAAERGRGSSLESGGENLESEAHGLTRPSPESGSRALPGEDLRCADTIPRLRLSPENGVVADLKPLPVPEGIKVEGPLLRAFLTGYRLIHGSLSAESLKRQA
jgi:hypothetical protein